MTVEKVAQGIPQSGGPCAYNRGMNKTTKLQPAHNGAFLVNETAANDPICQAVMADYLEELKRERKRREWFAKWEATRPEGQFGTWNISDRH